MKMRPGFREGAQVLPDAGRPPLRPTMDERFEQMRRILDEHRSLVGTRGARSEFDADGNWKFEGVAAELRAERDGREMGARFAGDPWRACRVLGIKVVRCNATALAAAAGRPIMGRWLPRSKVIQLADNLRARDERETLGHEFAHALGYGHDDDRIADVFGRAFIKQTPNPYKERAAAVAAWEARLRARALGRMSG